MITLPRTSDFRCCVAAKRRGETARDRKVISTARSRRAPCASPRTTALREAPSAATCEKPSTLSLHSHGCTAASPSGSRHRSLRSVTRIGCRLDVHPAIRSQMAPRCSPRRVFVEAQRTAPSSHPSSQRGCQGQYDVRSVHLRCAQDDSGWPDRLSIRSMRATRYAKNRRGYRRGLAVPDTVTRTIVQRHRTPKSTIRGSAANTPVKQPPAVKFGNVSRERLRF